ncbi:hypothetical protein Baya_3225 [Bagarius yarrelli]|uniref:Uncharacterized protein n=1 Tax=Bagarius yarrelli TaxID=175774 RepID=A0A556TS05_BAGYA|nr:hypothetical protein Baya_3225 [Bagarius yarrelli]
MYGFNWLSAMQQLVSDFILAHILVDFGKVPITEAAPNPDELESCGGDDVVPLKTQLYSPGRQETCFGSEKRLHRILNGCELR